MHLTLPLVCKGARTLGAPPPTPAWTPPYPRPNYFSPRPTYPYPRSGLPTGIPKGPPYCARFSLTLPDRPFATGGSGSSRHLAPPRRPQRYSTSLTRMLARPHPGSLS